VIGRGTSQQGKQLGLPISALEESLSIAAKEEEKITDTTKTANSSNTGKETASTDNKTTAVGPRARVTARKEHVGSNQTGDLSSQEDKTEISMEKASSQSVKQLMFLHIPKTGGSSIESSAAKGGHS
jgi:hypothetical protein